jgi:hypothetical protein
MQRNGYSQCTPLIEDNDIDRRPLLDLSSGYILRGVGQFPKQGRKAPWQQNQNYLFDLVDMKFGALDNPGLKFSRPHPPLQHSA